MNAQRDKTGDSRRQNEVDSIRDGGDILRLGVWNKVPKGSTFIFEDIGLS